MKVPLVLIAVASISCLSRHASAQSGPSGQAQLIGTWRFVSATQLLTDGTSRPDPQTGANGAGYLMYTETGHMCAVIAKAERPAWRAPASPSDSAVRQAFNGLVAYCGTYDVDAAEGSVTHHIEVDREPQLTGTNRKRFFTRSGAQLVLRAALPLPDGVREWTIVWQRVGP
jgi:Lipocalin-like domain